jgi:hypothetical protein
MTDITLPTISHYTQRGWHTTKLTMLLLLVVLVLVLLLLY